jgi:hypothetical protein
MATRPSGLAGTAKRLLVIVAIEQRVRYVAIAMGPAIDGDRQNVARTGKPSLTEHAVELVAEFRLEIRKRHIEKLSSVRNCARASRPATFCAVSAS